jgi:hypothetical protein
VTNKRTRPLSAPLVDDLGLDSVIVDDDVVPHVGLDADERQRRFAVGIRELRVGSTSVVLSERILLVLAGIVAPLGLIVVVLGWWGASQTPYLFEQVPYLISGGLLGLALVFLGAFFYFAHWLTELVKEHRAQSAAVIEALDRLSQQIADQRSS